MTRIHDDEADTGVATVRALLAAQCPGHADLPLVRVEAPGTDNAMYRLGADLLGPAAAHSRGRRQPRA